MKRKPEVKNRFSRLCTIYLIGRDGFLHLKFLRIIFLIALFVITINITEAQTNQGDTIKIGLLIRDKKDAMLLNTARLAIEFANKSGGYKGKPFNLEFRSCDGPWGVGSKQAVDLFQEAKVSLVVAAVDGRNAHLAEQVSAKSHAVLVDALASDPTLSRAYVPWYYRMVPDDKQQAEVLLEEIYLRKKATRVAMIALDNYDGKMAANTFSEQVRAKGLPAPQLLLSLNEQQLLEKVKNISWDAIILAGTSANYHLLNDLITTTGNTSIFAFHNIYNFWEANETSLEKILYPRTSGFRKDAWMELQKKYLDKYKTIPSPSMAYLYDAILLAVESIRKFGPDSQAIKTGFKSLKYQGITGQVVFSSLGNREADFILH